MELPPVKTQSGHGKRRVVGFETTSPSSVLRDSPASSDDSRRRQEGLESPLSSALKRELSMPHLHHAAPALPKLKLGLGRKAMPRSKSHGNLLSTQPAEVPQAFKQRSATSSPHAASSGGSEPVRIPFEFSRCRSRTLSVDVTQQPGLAPGESEDEMVSTPVISAASSLLGHHLGGLVGGAASGTATASAAGSPLSGSCAAMTRTQSATKDLFVAQADAVMAHAQVQNLQTALRKEQDEVVRLREQLQAMTAERDRLLAELQTGGDSPPVFDMDSGHPVHAKDSALLPAASRSGLVAQQQQPGAGGGLRITLRLR